MQRPLSGHLAYLRAPLAISLAIFACREQTPRRATAAESSAAPPSEPASATPPSASEPSATKVEHREVAMGTSVHFVAYTNPRVDGSKARAAFAAAAAEMRRLENVLSEWRSDTEVGRINLKPGEWVAVGEELFA